jgi:hypothetical protein
MSPAGALQKDAGLIGRGIGRVLTNIVEPYGYSVMDKLRRVKNQGLVNNIKAVVNDTPAYQVVLGRDLPYRRMFGLPAHKGGLGYYTKNAPGSFRFRGNSRKSDIYLSGVADDGLAAARAGTPAGGSFHGKDHTVMAGYDGKLGPDDMVQYRDRWDVDLHPGERPLDDHRTMARWAMSKITKPITIEGQVNARTLQSGPIKQANWSRVVDDLKLIIRGKAMAKFDRDGADKLIRQSMRFGGAGVKEAWPAMRSGSKLLQDASPGRPLTISQALALATRKAAEKPLAGPTSVEVTPPAQKLRQGWLGL